MKHHIWLNQMQWIISLQIFANEDEKASNRLNLKFSAFYLDQRATLGGLGIRVKDLFFILLIVAVLIQLLITAVYSPSSSISAGDISGWSAQQYISASGYVTPDVNVKYQYCLDKY